MEEFKIVECTSKKIIVNREPQNDTEKEMMDNAVMDAIARENLATNPNVLFPS